MPQFKGVERNIRVRHGDWKSMQKSNLLLHTVHKRSLTWWTKAKINKTWSIIPVKIYLNSKGKNKQPILMICLVDVFHKVYNMNTKRRCCPYYNKTSFFFFFSQLRCGRGPRPERQASYLHSTSHIRLTSIKKTTPTAAAITPAANGNSNRQEVALWSGMVSVRDFQLHLIPAVLQQNSCSHETMRGYSGAQCVDESRELHRPCAGWMIVPVLSCQIILNLATKQKVPHGNTRSDMEGNSKTFSAATTLQIYWNMFALNVGRSQTRKESF